MGRTTDALNKGDMTIRFDCKHNFNKLAVCCKDNITQLRQHLRDMSKKRKMYESGCESFFQRGDGIWINHKVSTKPITKD